MSTDFGALPREAMQIWSSAIWGARHSSFFSSFSSFSTQPAGSIVLSALRPKIQGRKVNYIVMDDVADAPDL